MTYVFARRAYVWGGCLTAPACVGGSPLQWGAVEWCGWRLYLGSRAKERNNSDVDAKR